MLIYISLEVGQILTAKSCVAKNGKEKRIRQCRAQSDLQI